MLKYGYILNRRPRKRTGTFLIEDRHFSISLDWMICFKLSGSHALWFFLAWSCFQRQDRHLSQRQDRHISVGFDWGICLKLSDSRALWVFGWRGAAYLMPDFLFRVTVVCHSKEIVLS